MFKLPDKDFYVVLTGSKNNAGDFLIKHQAKRLLNYYRPDRKIIDFNAWEQLDTKKLDLINQSKALILLGGPALQHHMYPNIYKLAGKLSQIQTKIVAMGVGWKSISGDWGDCYSYSLSDSTLELLEVIENSSYISSVRDLHTLTVLQSRGFKNFKLTGCPALFNLDFQPEKIKKLDGKAKTVAFSLGVSFLKSEAMKRQMKELVMRLYHMCLSNSQDFKVVFHHSLDAKVVSSSSSSTPHLLGHLNFLEWIKEKGIAHIDISGSAENLTNFYDEVDFHIGYRVHAHIYMCSLGKKSLLISEDGRANSLQATIGGNIIKGYSNYKSNKVTRLLKLDPYTTVNNLNDVIIERLNYELKHGNQFTKQSVSNISSLKESMLNFIAQLP